MRYLITGGCGFVGSNLASKVLDLGEELIIFDNLTRIGSHSNLDLLRKKGEFKFFPYDIRNTNDVENVIIEIKPDVIFHLAGQVAMTTSILNPRLDFETNILGTYNLLEAVRKYSPYSVLLYSSTNKVYGDFAELDFEESKSRYFCEKFPNGINENYPLNFHSPYGCSKGAADQYILDYNRIYGLQSVVFRHSSMYGSNQKSTIDQGWIGWFISQALKVKNGDSKSTFTISGTGKQVRDVLNVSDVLNLYFCSVENISKICGQVFNIGGGVSNSLSLLELFDILEEQLDIQLKYERIAWRESDQKVFIADISKVKKILNWTPQIDSRKGIVNIIKNYI